MYNDQYHSVLYNNTVRPVICEVWYFTQLYVRFGILLTVICEVWYFTQLYVRFGILLSYM
jgi:hypothetical protein